MKTTYKFLYIRTKRGIHTAVKFSSPTFRLSSSFFRRTQIRLFEKNINKMKLLVKSTKGPQFTIEATPQDTVADVKKIIENTHGVNVYPAAQHMLIHYGKVLEEMTTLEENKVDESSFIVIMSSKTKASSGESLTASSGESFDESSTESENEYDQATSNLVAGSSSKDIFERLVGLVRGSWDEKQVASALKAANNDPLLALDDLYLNYPPVPVVEKGPPPASTQ